MESSYFAPVDPTLPPEEHQARMKRQQHAEWGIAIAQLGGTRPTPALLQELQRYIDGEASRARARPGRVQRHGQSVPSGGGPRAVYPLSDPQRAGGADYWLELWLGAGV